MCLHILLRNRIYALYLIEYDILTPIDTSLIAATVGGDRAQWGTVRRVDRLG